MAAAPEEQATSDPSGFVYLIVHPSYPGWVKVGQTNHPARRLGNYNTGDPYRSYRMLCAIPTSNRRHAEWVAHTRLKRLGYPREGEWFEVAPATAERVVIKAVAQVEETPLA